MAKVLIADDEELAARTLGMFLSDRGHSVETATDGPQAMNLLERFLPDFLIADYLLGDEIKGTDVARSLQVKKPDAQVLLVTGFPADMVKNDARGIGHLRVITKPVDLDEVEALIADGGNGAH